MTQTHTITVEPLGREVECREDQTHPRRLPAQRRLAAALLHPRHLRHVQGRGARRRRRPRRGEHLRAHGLRARRGQAAALHGLPALRRHHRGRHRRRRVDRGLPGAGLHRHGRRARPRSPATPCASSSSSTARSGSTPGSTSSSRCRPATGCRRSTAPGRSRRRPPRRASWSSTSATSPGAGAPTAGCSAGWCSVTRVSVSGPYGRFVLKTDDDRHAILVGGGTGLAPLKSMVRHALEDDAYAGHLTLYQGARSREWLYDVEYFRLSRSAVPRPVHLPAVPVRGDRGRLRRRRDGLRLRHGHRRHRGRPRRRCPAAPATCAARRRWSRPR